MLARGILEHNWDISPRDPHAIPWGASRQKDWELYNMKEDRTELTDLRHKDQGLATNMAADSSIDISPRDPHAWGRQNG